MVSGGQPLRIGPFLGGLNTASDPTAIADAELAELMNFELDIDGSLISRPPFVKVAEHIDWTERIKVIGIGIFDGDVHIIGSNINGVYRYQTDVWTEITATFEASFAIQYAGVVYLIPASGNAELGGKWDPVDGFVVIADIPVGGAAVIHKERMYIVPGIDATSDETRLKFSDAGDAETWPASNFVDIGQGDGTNLVDITIFQDNLILFKEHTSYIFAYDIRPEDAISRKISNTIGVADQYCMVNYENSVFVYHGGWVYEIINFDFKRINTKIPFELDQTLPVGGDSFEHPVFLSLIGDRLVARYFENIYVYGLRTRTWSQWESSLDALNYFGPVIKMISDDLTSTNAEYFAGSCVANQTNFIRIVDGRNSTIIETDGTSEAIVEDTFTRSEIDGWGIADTGQTWTVSGLLIDDYSVNGSEGQVTMTVEGAGNADPGVSIQNIDVTYTVDVNQVATGHWFISRTLGRFVDGLNHYAHQLEFKDDGSLGQAIYKLIAGTMSVLSFDVGGTYAADEKINVRFLIEHSNLKSKVWKTIDPEPVNWDIEIEDFEYELAGPVIINTERAVDNTNVDAIMSYDDIVITNIDSITHVITCIAKTKNFDMAVPHQFKRLWWWGVDVSTENIIIGKATPIIVSSSTTWAEIETVAWENLGIWAQPLTESGEVASTITTITGTDRRFAKFLKSLRYRQINYEVELTTNGSTVDGPARLFTIMALTVSKQVVSKAVS